MEELADTLCAAKLPGKKNWSGGGNMAIEWEIN